MDFVPPAVSDGAHIKHKVFHDPVSSPGLEMSPSSPPFSPSQADMRAAVMASNSQGGVRCAATRQGS